MGPYGTLWDTMGHFGTKEDIIGEIIVRSKGLLKVRQEIIMVLYETGTICDFRGLC